MKQKLSPVLKHGIVYLLANNTPKQLSKELGVSLRTIYNHRGFNMPAEMSDLNPAEWAGDVRKMVKLGMSQSEIAGLLRTTIGKVKYFYTKDSEVRKIIASKRN